MSNSKTKSRKVRKSKINKKVKKSTRKFKTKIKKCKRRAGVNYRKFKRNYKKNLKKGKISSKVFNRVVLVSISIFLVAFFSYRYWHDIYIPRVEKEYISDMEPTYKDVREIVTFLMLNQDKLFLYDEANELQADELSLYSQQITSYEEKIMNALQNIPELKWLSSTDITVLDDNYEAFLQELDEILKGHKENLAFYAKILPTRQKQKETINKINELDKDEKTNLKDRTKNWESIVSDLKKINAEYLSNKSYGSDENITDVDSQMQFVGLYLDYANNTLEFYQRVKLAQDSNKKEDYTKAEEDYNAATKAIITDEKEFILSREDFLDNLKEELKSEIESITALQMHVDDQLEVMKKSFDQI